MVREAEQHRAEDEQHRSRIDARNSLEAYAFQMKSSIDEPSIKDKLTDTDRQTVLNKCSEVLSWIDGNQTATKEEFDYQEKELENVCQPVMTKLHQGASPGSSNTSSQGGPTVEEVD